MSKISTSSGHADSDIDELFLEGAPVAFQHERPTQDKAWSIAVLCCLVTTLVVGLYASFNRASDATFKNTSFFLAKPQSCQLLQQPGRKLQQSVDQQGNFSSSTSMFWEVAFGIVLSTAGSFGVGVIYILLFKRVPHLMVNLTLWAYFCIITISGWILSRTSYHYNHGEYFKLAGILMLCVAAASARIFHALRNEIDLCSRLLGVSVEGLKRNPCLVLFVLAVNVVAVHALLIIAGLIYLATSNNGQAVPSSAKPVGDVCHDIHGVTTPCCVWQTSSWAWGYSAFAAAMMFWIFFMTRQFSTFVVSGTIAQWYYTPLADSGTFESTKGNTRRSIDHGLGPSLGTICFGGVVLFIIEWVRFFMYSCRVWIVGDLFHSVTSHLTRFAVVMASISGEDFISAGKKSTALLLRNRLKSFGVWWIPSFVMKISALLVALMWAGVVLLIQTSMAAVSNDVVKGRGILAFGVMGLAHVAFWISLVVLLFFGSILLSIVDATYLCYAIDRDTQTITKEEVHDVFAQVPIGAAVKQPDGQLQYGNPAAGVYNFVPPSDPDAAQPLQKNATCV